MQGISSSTHSADYGRAYVRLRRTTGGELAEFFEWYFREIPHVILRASQGYLRITYFELSLPLLLRTLFAPWRRDVHSMDGLPLQARFQVMVENLMSRVFGAIIRLFVFVFGVIFLIGQALFFSLTFLLWFGAPIVAILLLAQALRLLGGGG